MDLLALVLSLIALAMGGLALRRSDVVERRVRRWLPEREAVGSAAVAGSAVGSAAVAGSAPGTAALPDPQNSGATGVDPAAIIDLRRRVAAIEGADAGKAAAANGGSGLSRIGVVRYDAFEDQGGRMSFSAALLDQDGRGLVLTAIHGRGETRSYLKQIPAPEDAGQRELSPEESLAVSQAMKAVRS